jgi:NADP-dependent 3-hydroxy acid dehydrogenase YdfG
MSKTIVIIGFGPGVSTAVAEKFGSEGFSVALIARNPARLAAGVAALEARGVTAVGFAADAGDPAALRGAIAKVRTALGPVAVIHWNAYKGEPLGDLLAIDPASLRAAFDLSIVGLLSAVQEALPDLKAAKDGAILVTNGAYGEINPMIDAFVLGAKAEGVALGNAAKAKLVGLLAARLKNEDVYVGEVTIAGVVSTGGRSSPDLATIDAGAIAETFWRLYKARAETRARIA